MLHLDISLVTATASHATVDFRTFEVSVPDSRDGPQKVRKTSLRLITCFLSGSSRLVRARERESDNYVQGVGEEWDKETHFHNSKMLITVH